MGPAAAALCGCCRCRGGARGAVSVRRREGNEECHKTRKTHIIRDIKTTNQSSGRAVDGRTRGDLI